MACGSSGNLMSFSCCGRFMFFTAERARVGAADMPACNIRRKKALTRWALEAGSERGNLEWVRCKQCCANFISIDAKLSLQSFCVEIPSTFTNSESNNFLQSFIENMRMCKNTCSPAIDLKIRNLCNTKWIVTLTDLRGQNFQGHSL